MVTMYEKVNKQYMYYRVSKYSSDIKLLYMKIYSANNGFKYQKKSLQENYTNAITKIAFLSLFIFH